MGVSINTVISNEKANAKAKKAKKNRKASISQAQIPFSTLYDLKIIKIGAQSHAP